MSYATRAFCVRLALTAAASLLVLCSYSSNALAGTPPVQCTQVTAAPTGSKLAACAATQLGVPYRALGRTPNYELNPGFDCSGFTSFVMYFAGKSLDPLAKNQWKQGALIPLPNGSYYGPGRGQFPGKGLPRTGDLVFFTPTDGSKEPANTIDHVGMFVGGTGANYDLYIHARGTGYAVEYAHLFATTGSLPKRYFGYARYI